jgi:PTS system nitrogen regulatory IIA component
VPSDLLLRSTSVDLMLCRVTATDRSGVIATMAARLAEIDPGVEPERIQQVALSREEIESTAIGEGVALPHARTDGVQSTRLCVATLARPVDWDAWDDLPVRVVFLILGSRRVPAQQLRVLADVSGLVRQRGLVERIAAAEDPVAMYEAIRSACTRQA